MPSSNDTQRVGAVEEMHPSVLVSIEDIASQRREVIFHKIQELRGRIAEAGELLEQAEGRKGGIFRGKGDKIRKHTETITLLTGAMREMTELIQESSTLATLPYRFTEAMSKETTEVLTKNLMDRDLQIQQLAGRTKEQTTFLLAEAQKNVRQEGEIQDLQEWSQEKDRLDSKQSEDIASIETELAAKRAKIAKLQASLAAKRAKMGELESSLASLRATCLAEAAAIAKLELRSKALERRSLLASLAASLALVVSLLAIIASLALHFL